ncbi:hypothetical protein C6A87_010570 [Mycobacterium sp. ITM-2016-00317]|uniref:hypothetical protein n=1 Tax=Mycobacterium sp. ITM-2016-00317 TaxID=2099694 RepID=UPI00287F5ED4|nr:hypothetical protein [Mycobacterium sp. ITM-2016-00317]WNG89555.1 hypothetical protein C6A87_010570 [Mycobacterium sp. ITM-2016-00317]
MRARTFETGSVAGPSGKRSGVRIDGETVHTYDLHVIAADVDGVVAAAGGWLCDRARAGWQVTVAVPPDRDVRALTILGLDVDAHQPALTAPPGTAAVAVDARVLRDDERLRERVLDLVDAARAEVTVWGDPSPVGSDGRFDKVVHRLSAAARAFKARALQTTGQVAPDLAVESFVSAALWYPPDGADLMPLSER